MSRAFLRVVEVEPVVCWSWRLRDCADLPEHPVGGTCNRCSRDVAVPRDAGTREPVCLYCALDAGIIPEVEIAPEF